MIGLNVLRGDSKPTDDLFIAAGKGHFEEVSALLKAGALTGQQGDKGQGCAAVLCRSARASKGGLGPDPGRRAGQQGHGGRCGHDYGRCHAIGYGEVVVALHKAGARVQCRWIRVRGATPLMVAARKGQLEVLLALIKAGAM